MCSYNNVEIFGEIQDGIMKLNAFGDIIKEEWEKTPRIRKNIALGEYIVMPNHFHGIIEILEQITSKKKKNKDQFQSTPTTFKSPSQNIGAIIRGFKGASTQRIKNIMRSRGELQFAPTAPTAPTALTTPSAPSAPSAPLVPSVPSAPTAPTVPTIDLTKSIWQRNYFEHIIKNDIAYQNIRNYIINNPEKWDG